MSFLVFVVTVLVFILMFRVRGFVDRLLLLVLDGLIVLYCLHQLHII